MRAADAEGKNLEAKLVSTGGLNGKYEGGSFAENFEMSILFVIDGQSLLTPSVQLSKLTGEVTFIKDSGRSPFVNQISAEQIEIQPAGFCNTLIGSAKILKEKNGRSIHYSDKIVEIEGSKFNFPLADCHRRPTVDLSRLLPFKN